MSPSMTALAYLVAGVLFILALRGLSSPVTARAGNRNGMIGMAIAIVATLLRSGMSGSGYVSDLRRADHRRRHRHHRVAPDPDDGAAAVGGGIPFAGRPGRGVRGGGGVECAGRRSASACPAISITQSLVEMSVGLAIGAVTFTGSLIAFAKLQALMKGTPITFKYQHHRECGCWACCWWC